jgi:hypothetical protein
MATYKGKNITILESEPSDYVPKSRITDEHGLKTVPTKDIKHEHLQHLTSHQAPVMVKDEFHHKFVKK